MQGARVQSRSASHAQRCPDCLSIIHKIKRVTSVQGKKKKTKRHEYTMKLMKKNKDKNYKYRVKKLKNNHLMLVNEKKKKKYQRTNTTCSKKKKKLPNKFTKYL